MSRTRRHVLLAAAAAGIAGATLFLLRPAPVLVETSRAVRRDLRLTVEEEGKTRVRERFVLSAPAAGRLHRVTLREGDPVAEGAAVALLDPLPLDARTREEARARLDAAEAERRAADARVRQAREALAQARRDHKRADALASQGLRAPGEREQAELLETTRARELDAARYAATAAAFQADAVRAVLVAGEPGRVGGAIPLRSPVAGRVLRIAQESERSVAAGTPVVEVGEPGSLEIAVDLLSTDAVRVSPGMEMHVDGGEGVSLRGRVRTIEPAAFTKISALGVEEQRVWVIGDLLEPAGRLGDGYRVEAAITIWEGKGVLTVPGSALFRRGAGWSAFVVESGRARRHDVEVGHRGADDAEIVRGLAEGETVILHPTDTIRDGTRVRPPASRER
ncbi:MAG TPA: HlyD family efflux transporter periplasmic adaptor subunit [Thermoanaerobaculia bacterium]|jgi:HlyD family secretion protein|nr:HlyD family efflux transporter periplasmic adaptor subunit [Thermoanaerobaculia bacterium]